MFYSHEVLTSKKYGVATVWLVATIGSQSKLRKVSRKQISDVDVKKACNTVIFPEAPMALRLQGNLLYGVSRVYFQQCDYVLSDVLKAQEAMRNLLRASRTNELDPNAGKAHPDQLMLMDDPAFMPEDLELPALDFDLSDLKIESQNSYLSPGPRRRATSDGSSRASSVLGLRISNSSGSGNSRGTYQLPDDNPFAATGSSAHKLPTLKVNLRAGVFDDEEMGLDEPDFEFDADGNEVQVIGSDARPRIREKLLSGSAASGAVRLELEEAQATRGVGNAMLADDGDFNMMLDEDGEFGGGRRSAELDPNAEAFPISSARAKSRGATTDEDEFKPSSDSGGASQRKARKPRAQKFIELDRTLVYSNSQIRAMAEDYLANMQKAVKVKQGRLLTTVAQNNAMMWIFGDGIGGIGRGIGHGTIRGPLQEMFSGANLMAAINDISRPSRNSSPKRGASPVADGSDDQGRRVRPRLEEDIDVDMDMDNMGRGDDMQPLAGEEGVDIEVGREAHDALDDHMSSAMPWNSARGASSSVLGGTGGRGFGSGSLRHGSILIGSQVGRGVREGSRVTSASPLFNRGHSIVPLEHGSDDFAGHPGSDNYGVLSGEHDYQKEYEDEQFELYGPAAQVDTQTANRPRWISDALDLESYNFMDYIKNIARQNRRAMGKGKGIATGDEGSVHFNQLIPSREALGDQKVPSVLVAAQGFLHVLTLATKGLLRVEQKKGTHGERVGEIRLWVIGDDGDDDEVYEMPPVRADDEDDFGGRDDQMDDLEDNQIPPDEEYEGHNDPGNLYEDDDDIDELAG